MKGNALIYLAAMDSRLVTALAVLGGLAVFALLFIITSSGELRGRRKARVPVGFRPGPSDEELERRVQVNMRAWGALMVMFMSIWLPVYWLREPARLKAKRAQFIEQQIIADTSGNTGGKALYEELCARCHGDNGEGGIQSYVLDGEQVSYAEPPLRYIYDRYRQAGRTDDEIDALVREAINKGRSNTPMPTWGLAYGGPLISHQVDTIVLYLNSIQEPMPKPDTTDGAELFAANCAICHGEDGTGLLGPNLTVALERLTADQLRATIEDGRINENRPSMPSWEFLGDEAVDALVQFVQGIQRGA